MHRRPLLFFCLTVVVGQCPPGLYPFPSAYQPSTCSPQDVCGCQILRLGASCQYSQQHMRYICCAGQAQQCGAKSSPLISSTGQIAQCEQGTGLCPSGFSCMQNACCATELHAACSDGKCLNGQVYVDGQCLNRVPIGAPCRRREQCIGGATCINSRCECPRGTSNMDGECVQSGNACELGMVLVNGECVSLASPGMDCIAQEQCIDHSQCASNRCQCIQGYQYVSGYCVRNTGGACQPTQTWINNRCVTYSIVGGPCIANEQCVGGATCQSSFCACEQGYAEMFGFCILDNSPPQCSDSQVLVNGKCLEKAAIGNSCQVTAQCLGGSECRYGLCQCPAGQSAINGVCSGGTGACPPSQVMVNGQCMDKVVIGSRCTYTQQCLGNSNCLNNICQCPSGSTQFNRKCSSPQCPQNQVLIYNQCIPMVAVGGRCSYGEECTGYSECSNGYCRCPNGAAPSNGICDIQSSGCRAYQVSVNNQCLDKMSIGQSCSSTAQCIVNARCSSMCECQYPNTYNGTACVSGIYYCSAGTVSVSNRCLSLVQLGQSCQNTAQCMAFSICSNGRCTCRPDSAIINGVCRSNAELVGCAANQVLIRDQCYPLSQVGGACAYSEQCQGGSVCQSGYCRCPVNTVDGGDGTCRDPNSGDCKDPTQTVKYENGMPINCLYARCPSGSHCEYGKSVQHYVCCG